MCNLILYVSVSHIKSGEMIVVMLLTIDMVGNSNWEIMIVCDVDNGYIFFFRLKSSSHVTCNCLKTT